MGFWESLFGKAEEPKNSPEEVLPEPEESFADSLELGWFWSEKKNEFQLARIPQKDRATHFYIIGATGSGKTKFIESLIRQDIEDGNGFAVIDPHGDLVEDIKTYLAERQDSFPAITDKVILIDPTDPDYTITFNPLENLPDIPLSEQVNELISAFRKIWADSWGVRMEDLMRNSLMALGEAELTLGEFSRFILRRDFRKIVLEKVTHPMVKDYFYRFDSMTDKGQITWIEPVMNKFNAFLSDDRIRQIFSSGTQSSFNFREVMDNGKILLVKLDKGRLKDAADLLGSLIMAKIQMAAFSRANIPQHRRRPFYLYIDEFQNFATASFMVVLSEARKYGLSLVMAHQTLVQIPAELKSLILGNTGIQIYFRVNHQDASLLAKEAFEYSTFGPNEKWDHKVEDLQTLPPRYFFVKHKVEGGILPLRTVELESPWESESIKKAKKNLGRKYMISRKELAVSVEDRQKIFEEEIQRRKRAEKVAEKEKEAAPIQEVPKAEAMPEPVETAHPKVHSPAPKEKRPRVDIPIFEGTGGSQHRYIQTLIKRMAEEKGFRAIIERATADGQGNVDVGVERDGKSIAFEIAFTSPGEHEVQNIQKCIADGYEQVVSCSPDKKILKKINDLAAKKFSEEEMKKVFFLQPEEIYFFLENESVGTKEKLVKGYKVKVNYQPVKEAEGKSKKDAVTQIIAKALHRIKGK